jgi:hypothetical protein
VLYAFNAVGGVLHAVRPITLPTTGAAVENPGL